ncbi:MAG: hypothetical protein JXA14_00610, partial [Anaerolineae bacterium]|nr:hypothetical protein [Anaerolineae bacterium]
MTKPLHVPDEPRFARALALAVDPGDTLTLLLEIGALQNQDLSIVRRTREALDPAYDHASDRKDWEQAHTVGVLQQALAAPDSAAYLAYHTRGLSPGEATDRFAHALTIVGCAADTLAYSRRPWEIESDDLGLPHWREQIWRLLLDTPDNALPQ